MTPIRIVKGARKQEQKPQVQTPAPQPAPKGMSVTWKRWFVGSANAALSGIASGGTAQFVGVDLKHSLMIAGASAFVSFCKWYAQHPLPGADQ
jgi:hypothetical protein